MSRILRFLPVLFLLVFSNLAYAIGTNPFLASANEVVSCTTDGSQMPRFVLCGASDSRFIEVTDPLVQSVQWQLLDDSSCAPAGQYCPNTNGSCIWNTVSTNTSFIMNNGGEYRAVLTYASAPTEIFYATTYQTIYDDVAMIVQEISANGASDGILEISGSGNSGPYIFRLEDGNGNALGPFQTSPIFENLPPGDFQIRTQDSSQYCEYLSNIITLTEPAPLTGNLIATQAPSCTDSGELVINASGGVEPYTYSLNGGTYVTTNTFSNLSEGNYSATVKDTYDNTVSTNSVTLVSSAPIDVTITVQSITCYGTTDGAIVVQASGGSPEYQYELLDGNSVVLVAYQNSDTFVNLGAGFYMVNVRDQSGCVTTSSQVTMDEPAPLDATFNTQDLTGYQSQDGSITINVSGGAGGYQYAISPDLNTFYTNNVFSGLSVGTYEVIVQDASGCSVNNFVTLNEPGSLEFNITVTQELSCIDPAEIQIAAAGGVAPYEYSMDNGASYTPMSDNTEIIAGLNPGTYQITVRDTNGLTYINSITIEPIEPLEISLTATDMTCAGDLDGSITATVTGGIGTYHYKLMDIQGNDIRPYQTSNTFVDLSYGIYQVEVIDTGSCALISPSIEVYEAAELVVDNFVTQNSTYYGADDGSISFDVTGGSPPYSYSVNSSAYTAFNGQPLSDLAAGDYIIYVRDANGCETNTIQTITEPEELLVSLDVPPIVCGVSIDTQVEVTASGGTGDFLYAIDSTDPNDAQYSSSFLGVMPGSHYIAVLDASGYVKIVDFEVAEPESMILKSEIFYDNINKTATVQLVVSGGVAPYTYTMEGQANVLEGATVSGLTEGSYTFIIRDKNSCASTITVQIDFADSDSDGLTDRDEDVNENGNYEDDDTDGDGTPDFEDEDDDGDGVPTIDEIDNSNGGKNTNQNKGNGLFLDTDADGVPNHRDNDDDGDGFLTLEEDYNGNGNPQDDDIDESGVADYLEKNINPDSVTEVEVEGEVVVFQNAGHTEFIALLWKAIQESETFVKIYNGRGNLVYTNVLEAGTYETELNVANLARGIYFVHIKNGDMEEVKKVLIQ